MNFEIKLCSGKTEYNFKIDDSLIKILDLLKKIISEMKLEKIPFTLVYKTDIIGSKNNEEILNTFFSEETNIILTIIKSAEIPKSFCRIEPLIYYINKINTSIDDYLLYLYNIYKDYENMSNNNILYRIQNINFIIFYYKNMYRLPKNCSPDKIYNNKQFIMYLVDRKPCGFESTSRNLENASKELQDDKEIIMIAVKNCGHELKYASKKLRDDEEIVKIAVQEHGSVLYYASKRLQNNEEIVKIAVKNCGEALYYASERLQNDENIVKIAVQQCGNSLSNASERLRNNEEIVMLAIENNKKDTSYNNILDCVSNRLKNNEKIVMAAIKKDIRLFKYASEELRNNKMFILNIIYNHYSEGHNPKYYLLEDISEILQDDEEIITAAVNKNGYNLKYASERLQNDTIIVTEAFIENNNAIMFASKELQNDIKFLLSLAKLKDDIDSSNLLYLLRLDKYGRDTWDETLSKYSS